MNLACAPPTTAEGEYVPDVLNTACRRQWAPTNLYNHSLEPTCQTFITSIRTFSSHVKSLFKPSPTHQVGTVDWRGVDMQFAMSPFQIRIRCFKWHWIQMLSIVNCIPWIVAEENKFNAQTQIIILNAKGTGLHSVQRHLFQIVGCINYGCWTRWTDAQTFPARDHP